MNTIAIKLSIFILMAVASTTALTIGATTTLAVSNTHAHQFQLMGNNDKGFVISSPSSSNEFGDFNSAQYAWSHPHHHHSSMIANYNGHNSNSTGSNDFNSAHYAWSHPHHHHSSMIAD
jgi:hypothetical protein